MYYMIFINEKTPDLLFIVSSFWFRVSGFWVFGFLGFWVLGFRAHRNGASALRKKNKNIHGACVNLDVFAKDDFYIKLEVEPVTRPPTRPSNRHSHLRTGQSKTRRNVVSISESRSRGTRLQRKRKTLFSSLAKASLLKTIIFRFASNTCPGPPIVKVSTNSGH